MSLFLNFFVSFFLLLPGICLSQESAGSDHVRIRILAPETFSSDSETVVALFFKIDPEWHVYWKNPGDSGSAPKFLISATNAKVGEIQWPAPSRIPVAHLTNFGYSDQVAYLFAVKPNGPGAVKIKVDLEWLVCKVECLPGFGKIEFERPAHNAVSTWKTADLELVQKFAKLIPSAAPSAPFELHASKLKSNQIKVIIKSKDSLPIGEIELFPLNPEFVSPASPEKSGHENFQIFNLFPAGEKQKSLGFVAVSAEGAWEFDRIEIHKFSSGSVSVLSLIVLIFSALVGGFLLNFMPCVFPVISIKVFSLLKAEKNDRVRDCSLYFSGVMATFVSLGFVFLTLRQAGLAVGWGFHLQSPLVVLLLILLFWLMALNFLGVFDVGTSIMNLAGRYSNRSSSFMTGVLSVFVAAPCTGPFMGSALGAASTLPTLYSLLIFASLGFGLAFPFLMFAFAPRTLSWLPKPGQWMNTLKQFFAFPLFATVLWLMWVLGQQTGTTGWLVAGCAILAISFSIWLAVLKSRWLVYIAWIFSIGAITFLSFKLKTVEHSPSSKMGESISWAAYDREKIKSLQSNGQAVFVDFTAAWCITCQVNKQVVLDTADAQKFFKNSKIFLMRADWTQYDPKITQALEDLGRNSVPVYAFYPADGTGPQILPQILTLSMIEALILEPQIQE